MELTMVKVHMEPIPDHRLMTVESNGESSHSSSSEIGLTSRIGHAADGKGGAKPEEIQLLHASSADHQHKKPHITHINTTSSFNLDHTPDPATADEERPLQKQHHTTKGKTTGAHSFFSTFATRCTVRIHKLCPKPWQRWTCLIFILFFTIILGLGLYLIIQLVRLKNAHFTLRSDRAAFTELCNKQWRLDYEYTTKNPTNIEVRLSDAYVDIVPIWTISSGPGNASACAGELSRRLPLTPFTYDENTNLVLSNAPSIFTASYDSDVIISGGVGSSSITQLPLPFEFDAISSLLQSIHNLTRITPSDVPERWMDLPSCSDIDLQLYGTVQGTVHFTLLSMAFSNSFNQDVTFSLSDQLWPITSNAPTTPSTSSNNTLSDESTHFSSSIDHTKLRIYDDLLSTLIGITVDLVAYESTTTFNEIPSEDDLFWLRSFTNGISISPAVTSTPSSSSLPTLFHDVRYQNDVVGRVMTNISFSLHHFDEILLVPNQPQTTYRYRHGLNFTFVISAYAMTDINSINSTATFLHEYLDFNDITTPLASILPSSSSSSSSSPTFTWTNVTFHSPICFRTAAILRDASQAAEQIAWKKLFYSWQLFPRQSSPLRSTTKILPADNTIDWRTMTLTNFSYLDTINSDLNPIGCPLNDFIHSTNFPLSDSTISSSTSSSSTSTVTKVPEPRLVHISLPSTIQSSVPSELGAYRDQSFYVLANIDFSQALAFKDLDVAGHLPDMFLDVDLLVNQTSSHHTGLTVPSVLTLQILSMQLDASFSRYSITIRVFDRKPQWSSHILLQSIMMGTGDTERYNKSETISVKVQPYGIRLRPQAQFPSLSSSSSSASPVLSSLLSPLIYDFFLPSIHSIIDSMSVGMKFADYSVLEAASSDFTTMDASPAAINSAFTLDAVHNLANTDWVAAFGIDLALEVDIYVTPPNDRELKAAQLDPAVDAPIIEFMPSGLLLGTWKISVRTHYSFLNQEIDFHAQFHVKDTAAQTDASCVSEVLGASSLTSPSHWCRYRDPITQVEYVSMSSYYQSRFLEMYRHSHQSPYSIIFQTQQAYELWNQPLWIQLKLLDLDPDDSSTDLSVPPQAQTWMSAFYFDPLMDPTSSDVDESGTYFSTSLSPHASYLTVGTMMIELAIPTSVSCVDQMTPFILNQLQFTPSPPNTSYAQLSCMDLLTSPSLLNTFNQSNTPVVCTSTSLIFTGLNTTILHESIRFPDFGVTVAHPSLNLCQAPILLPNQTVEITCQTASSASIDSIFERLECAATVNNTTTRPTATHTVVTVWSCSPVTCSTAATSTNFACYDCVSVIKINSLDLSSAITTGLHTQHDVQLQLIPTNSLSYPVVELSFP